MMIYWSLIFFSWKIQQLHCSCTFPVTGTWETSDHGVITFSKTEINNFTTISFGTSVYTCETNIGDKYMAKSSEFTLHGVNFTSYICLRFIHITVNKYQYYMATEKNPSASNERLKSAASNDPLQFPDVCDRTVYEIGSHSMMLKTGSALSELVECPSETLGNWSYTYSDVGGASICEANSSLDICSQNSTFSFDNTRCSQDILYSTDGTLHCIFSIQTTPSSYYITMYNADTTTNENTTFRFSCFYTEIESDVIRSTQYPGHCNSSAAVSLSLSFRSGSTQPPSTVSMVISTSQMMTSSKSSNSNDIYIVAGILSSILLFAIVGVVVYLIWKAYQRKLSKKKPAPDPKFAQGEIRNRRLNVHFEGALPTENNVTPNIFPNNSENDLSLTTAPSELEDTSDKPSSLTSLLISVPRNHNMENISGNDSIHEKESNMEEIQSELSSQANGLVNEDCGFNSIGVDTRGLKKLKKKKRGTKRRFRLRRSRSSVADTSSTIRASKNDSQKSKGKKLQYLRSLITQGTKTVVLGIQPGSARKETTKGNVDRSLLLGKIKESSNAHDDNKDRRPRMSERNHWKAPDLKKMLNPKLEKSLKLQAPTEKLSGGTKTETAPADDERQYPTIHFPSYYDASYSEENLH